VKNTMAQVALRRPDDRSKALSDFVSELLQMNEPRKRIVGEISGLDVHYDLGAGHPLLGRRMPDLDLEIADGSVRVYSLLHDARPVLLALGEPLDIDVSPWADRVRVLDAKYDGEWELPVIGAVPAPRAVVIRPDGYVAWVSEGNAEGLTEALTTWFGPPATA
jgi:3-(3-hydroxy-phenyl)propionate hydroxylase